MGGFVRLGAAFSPLPNLRNVLVARPNHAPGSILPS